MEVKTITTNGDHKLPERINVNRPFERTSVIILYNPDPATITFGVEDDEGNFVGYTNGIVTDDSVINHGYGASLMVRISGLSTYLKIGLSN